ncbi:hypothetical protein L5515_009345 [Caenorhabditis briggsae]|uniref:SPK domain-containing protein n=1 Tax=Caenorhabditis briggsae TaxID=6238 RepID=A0AAE9JNT4_CAEBR|nr:hypothetical protein L5515_009345 [Caenorhabditis briggsae]
MTFGSVLCEKAIRFILNGIRHYTHPENIVKWCELAKTEANYDSSAIAFSRRLKARLDRIEDLQGFTLMEKVRLVFIFSRPVSPRFLQILKDANCIVNLTDERKITFFCSPDGIVFKSEQSVNQKKYFKGKPENYKKRTVVKPAIRSSKSVRNPPLPSISPIIPNPPEVDDVEMGNEEEEAASEQKPEKFDGLTPPVNNGSNFQNQDARARDRANSQAQNFVQNNRNRVKMEDFVEDMQQAPQEWIPEEKVDILLLETISLLKLAEQIETLAFNINLEEGFQQKALRAVRLFKANDQTITIQHFNIFFNAILTSLKAGRIQNATRKSIQLSRLFKHLQRTLIRPMGEELMAEALAILDDEIEMLGESEDEVLLKTVQIRLDSLMNLATNSWADLYE